MKKNIAFAFVTIILFLFLSELVLRLLSAPPASKSFEWPPPDKTKHGMMPDNTLFWKLRPGYNDVWKLYKLAYTHELDQGRQIDWEARKKAVRPVYRDVRWDVNEAGVRGAPVPQEKPPKTKRLLFLGSSITFGWGVPEALAFAEQVRKELDSIYPDISFESINAGVPGYSSYQCLRYLEMILPLYHPDVVVVEFGINDGTIAVGKADKDWDPALKINLFQKSGQLLRTSGWGRLVLRILGRFVKKPDILDVRQTFNEARKGFYRVSMTGALTRVSPEDLRANIDRMLTLCRENNAVFSVYIPSLFNEFGKKELLPSVNISLPFVIPVHERLVAHSQERLETLFLPYDEGHLSVKGHQIVARAMVDYLAPRIMTAE